MIPENGLDGGNLFNDAGLFLLLLFGCNNINILFIFALTLFNSFFISFNLTSVDFFVFFLPNGDFNLFIISGENGDKFDSGRFGGVEDIIDLN